MIKLSPGLRLGKVTLPQSKSILHRVLIANFLAGDYSLLEENTFDADDIKATKKCLNSLLISENDSPIFDCGESASTLRFLSPIVAALGKRPIFCKKGQLSLRPNITYDELHSGQHDVYGHISSQFISGLLFALPLLKGDSEINFLTPLQSRGYVDLTCDILRKSGICFRETANGFYIPGNQKYKKISADEVEYDWSAASFWIAANSIGNRISLPIFNEHSLQPDSKILSVINLSEVDVRDFPDSFPALCIIASFREAPTIFTGIERLRIKESDRIEAMKNVLSRFGRLVKVNDNSFEVKGSLKPFYSGQFETYGDHRIAMAIAIAATRADADVIVDDEKCVSKSYPSFWQNYNDLKLLAY